MSTQGVVLTKYIIFFMNANPGYDIFVTQFHDKSIDKLYISPLQW